MTKDDTICEIKNNRCSNYFSCQYVQHRFRVIECCPKHKKIVNKVHQQELQERAKIKTWSDRKDYLIKEN